MEKLTVGEILSGTIETFQANLRAMLIYVVGLAALTTAAGLTLGSLVQIDLGDRFDWLGGMLFVGTGLVAGIAVIVFMLAAQYMLWAELLKSRTGLEPTNFAMFLPFVGQTLLAWIAIAFGLVLFIVPGLLLIGRWTIAPAILLAERKGVTGSMQESWDSISGNTTPLLLSMFVVWLVMAVASAIAGGGGMAAGYGALGFFAEFLNQLVSNFSSAVFIAMGIWVYRRLRHGDSDMAEVFS